MNLQRLKSAERAFFQIYPNGFEHPEMIKIAKKHKMPQMVDLCQQLLAKESFKNTDQVCDNLIKIVSRSSMISLFEKPKFREMVNTLNFSDKAFVANGFFQLLHGKQQLGFESLVDFFKIHKLAKWSLLSIIPAYMEPNKEVFVKPTTAKNVINYFQIPDLQYHATPTWKFYTGYRKWINSAKKEVDKSLSPSNPAFSGFLMMSIAQLD